MTDQTTSAPATHLELLTDAHAWLADRIAHVETDGLRSPTPCAEFDVATLLDHLATSVERFTASLSGTPQLPGVVPTTVDDVTARYRALRRANLAAWAEADMAATYRVPLGDVPAAVVANLNVAEVVLHGWDIGRATGECADVPDHLARAIHAFGLAFLSDDLRTIAFGPAVQCEGTASDEMAAFYGRRP